MDFRPNWEVHVWRLASAEYVETGLFRERDDADEYDAAKDADPTLVTSGVQKWTRWLPGNDEEGDQ
jgi:hypothetical protein